MPCMLTNTVEPGLHFTLQHTFIVHNLRTIANVRVSSDERSDDYYQLNSSPEVVLSYLRHTTMSLKTKKVCSFTAPCDATSLYSVAVVAVGSLLVGYVSLKVAFSGAQLAMYIHNVVCCSAYW